MGSIKKILYKLEVLIKDAKISFILKYWQKARKFPHKLDVMTKSEKIPAPVSPILLIIKANKTIHNNIKYNI